MKNSILVAAGLALSTLMVSCANNDMPDQDQALMKESNPISADTSAVFLPGDSGSAIVSSPVQMPANTTTGPLTVQPGQAVPTAAVAPAKSLASGALNPEHGKPGHRCDIPVGAPLSTPASTPAASAAPAATSSPGITSANKNQSFSVTPASAPSAAAPAKTAPGMNPPHGEPGHRCEIPVGAPLNSASTTTPAASPAPVAIPDFTKPAGSPVNITPPPLPEKKGE